MNRTLVRSVVAIVLLVVPLAVKADDAKDAREIVDKAIKALGGEAAIAKFDTMVWTSRGVFHGPNGDNQYSATYTVQWPDKLRFEIEGQFTLVVNGNQSWINLGGNTTDFADDNLAEQKNSVYAAWVARIVSLKDKDFTLTTAGETKVNDKPAVGVRVSRKDRPDIIVYFDKETNLPVKRERRGKPIDLNGMEVTIEDFFSDYKAIDGYQFANKVTMKRDGKVLVESENVDVKAGGKLDPKVFEK